MNILNDWSFITSEKSCESNRETILGVQSTNDILAKVPVCEGTSSIDQIAVSESSNMRWIGVSTDDSSEFSVATLAGPNSSHFHRTGQASETPLPWGKRNRNDEAQISDAPSMSPSRRPKRRKVRNPVISAPSDGLRIPSMPLHYPESGKDAPPQLASGDQRPCPSKPEGLVCPTTSVQASELAGAGHTVHFHLLSGQRTDKQQNDDEVTNKKIREEETRVLQIQRAMIADEDGDRPIHIAVVQEDLALVQRLTSLMKSIGASVDVFNYLRQTPLHLAVIVRNPQIVQILLDDGASVQLQDRHGNTSIQLAVKYFQKECFKILLAHPLSRNVLDSHDYEGFAALHRAIFQNNTSAVNGLYHAGADIDVVDGKSGRTGLIHAVLGRQVDMVRLLLQCGASTDKTDYSGQSVLELASQVGSGEVIKLIEKEVSNHLQHAPETLLDPSESSGMLERQRSGSFVDISLAKRESKRDLAKTNEGEIVSDLKSCRSKLVPKVHGSAYKRTVNL